jgi:hypothetical protein
MANKSRTESLCARILGKNFIVPQFFLKIIVGDQIEIGTLNEKKCDEIIIIKK